MYPSDVTYGFNGVSCFKNFTFRVSEKNIHKGAGDPNLFGSTKSTSIFLAANARVRPKHAVPKATTVVRSGIRT